MELLAQILVFITFIAIMYFMVSSAYKGMAKATKISGYSYVIKLKTEKTVDLENNKDLLKNVKIISHAPGSDTYAVKSKVNDKTLRENIKKAYNLSNQEVTVTSLQISGSLGAV